MADIRNTSGRKTRSLADARHRDYCCNALSRHATHFISSLPETRQNYSLLFSVRDEPMKQLDHLADGLYRLIKIGEDHNPLFPNRETVVEIRDGRSITNVTTGRSAQLSALRSSRVLYGPLNGPYDLRPVSELDEVVIPGMPPATDVSGAVEGE